MLLAPVSSVPEFHFSTEVCVRLPETDAMGVVFHGNYFTYLEVGRVDYLMNLGLTEGNRPIRDFDNVVVSAHLDFRAPSRLHDVLKIEVRVAEIRTASIRFEFRIRNRRSNVLVAEGHTVHCAIGDDFQPQPVPASFREVIDRFEQR
jgi:acyl-CoA thioester hydrolase